MYSQYEDDYAHTPVRKRNEGLFMELVGVLRTTCLLLD